MILRTREYAALALLPAALVMVLVVRGALVALRSDEYDVLTWSRLLSHVDELSDGGTLRFDAPDSAVPDLPQPLPPPPVPCPGGGIAFESGAPSEWQMLIEAGVFAGWPIG